MSTTAQSSTHQRLLAEQALSRAAGAPLLGGNALRLLIDAAEHYQAWLEAIKGAHTRILLENYIIRDDEVGRAFRDALTEKARAGVLVAVICDWLGCLGQSRAAFWQPLQAAGGQVRVFNRPRLGEPFGWISRDHRKLLVVDGEIGSLSGVCISAKWLGDANKGVPPWRDTGVLLRGPAVTELEQAFAQSWSSIGEPLPAFAPSVAPNMAGDAELRVIATQPATAGMYRLDQQIAAMARESLWLTDAYFVGVAPYIQALAAAAQDGVDVRLLVPGSSDIPMVAGLSRSGYRPLLKAGIRVFEWNGSMLHAKTAVADRRWARVGSSNLNIASWLSNREIDVAVENEAFAQQLARQYEADLDNATEILLAPRRRPHAAERIRRSEPTASPPRKRRRGEGGSSGRAAAGALRLANSVGAALSNRRVLGDTETGPVLLGTVILAALAFIALIWPRTIAWPVALLAAWFALNLGVRGARLRRRRRPLTSAADESTTT